MLGGSEWQEEEEELQLSVMLPTWPRPREFCGAELVFGTLEKV